MIKLFSFALSLLTLNSSAQTLHFCKEHPDNGIATSYANAFNFENTSAGFVYILYNGNQPITSRLLLKVDIMNGETFIPYNAYPLTAEVGKNYVGMDFEFKEEGDYKFSVTDGNNNLTVDFATVKLNYYADNFYNPDTYDNNYDSDNSSSYFDDPQSTMYYIDSKVKICEGVMDDQPVMASDEFKYKKSGNNLTVWVNNDGHGIITSTMKVYIDYKKKENDDEYETLETLTYPISGDPDTYTFKYKFNKKGYYSVRTYAIGTDGYEIWINDGYVTFK